MSVFRSVLSALQDITVPKSFQGFETSIPVELPQNALLCTSVLFRYEVGT